MSLDRAHLKVMLKLEVIIISVAVTTIGSTLLEKAFVSLLILRLFDEDLAGVVIFEPPSRLIIRHFFLYILHFYLHSCLPFQAKFELVLLIGLLG